MCEPPWWEGQCDDVIELRALAKIKSYCSMVGRHGNPLKRALSLHV